MNFFLFLIRENNEALSIYVTEENLLIRAGSDPEPMGMDGQVTIFQTR